MNRASRSTKLPRLYCALLCITTLLLTPLTAVANEVKGRLSAGAETGEVLPALGTDAAPLKDVTVILGVLERNPLWEPLAIFGKIASTKTNANGEYSFFLGPDPPPDVPISEIDYALIVVLDSPAVATFDSEAAANDAFNKPACLASAAFGVPTSGVHQVDLDLLADGGGRGMSVSSSLSIKGAEFSPVLDLTTGMLFGNRPDCDEAILNGPNPIFDVRGFSNLDPERFAHLGILHARAYNAFEFVRDGLSVDSPIKVYLQAWYDGIDSMGYDCSEFDLVVAPAFSDYFGEFNDSLLYSMRHEYGHHFVCTSDIAGANQAIPLGGGTAHGGLKNPTSSGSWSEGFATYFAAAAAQFHAEPDPHMLTVPGGEVNFGGDLITLDNPSEPGEQRTFDTSGEELAVAHLLWRVSAVTGADALITKLDAEGPNLLDFSAVYTVLRQDSAINDSFPPQCIFNDLLESIASRIDCLFIEHGFYHDANGDGLYTDSSEFLAANTRWPLSGPNSRSAAEFRPNSPIIEGSILRLSAIDAQSQPMSLDRFEFEIEFYPPFDPGNFTYTKEITGEGPYEFPIMLPARPSRAVITAIKNGLPFSDPITIESAYYHQRIDSFGDTPVEPILLDHVFSESIHPPTPLIFEDSFEAATGEE